MEERYQVTTTVETKELAESLARRLVEARLAACAQVDGPVDSIYWWQGEIQTAWEWRVGFKTTGARLDDLVEQIKAAHPYEVPEIIATPIVGGYPPYLTWITTETRK